MKTIMRLALVLLCGALLAPAQTVTVTSSLLSDSAGNLVTGQLSFQPTLSNGRPTAYRKGLGGTATSAVVNAYASNGAFTITLPDTTSTSPANICFALTYSGPNGANIGAGYSCLQPHTTATSSGDWCQAGVCNLDNYVPGASPQPTMGYVQSVNGCTGVCTLAAGSVVIAGDSDVTAQTASQSTVNLVGTVSATGKYRIGYYVAQHALCGSGSVSVLLTFSWTDSSSGRSVKSIALPLGSSQLASGSIQGVIPIYAVASSAIVYTSTVTGSCATGGPGSYDAHISVEAVQ